MSNIEIPAKKFYNGSTKKEYFYLRSKKHKRAKLEKEYMERPLPNLQLYDHCFSERKVWRWFARQQEALDYCSNKNEKCLCLFAYEKADGKRSYLVTTKRQFWLRYKDMASTKRHFYEVIRQTDVCRLYFDVEFKREFNPDVDGSKALQNFIRFVCYCVYKEYGVVCQENNVVDLSSSTAAKFSRHLIFNQPDLLFYDNVRCGYFVKEICYSLQNYLNKGPPDKYLPVKLPEQESVAERLPSFDDLCDENLKQVMIKTEKVGAAFLCDLCVYTKNRNFRFLLSSKVSKHVPLLVSERNNFKFRSKPTNRKEKYLKYQMRNTCFDAAFEMFTDTLVCPTEYREDSVLCSGGNKEQLNRQYRASHSNAANQASFQTGSMKTLFPKLDEFVIAIVNKNGPKAHIRRWLYYEDRQMVIYDIGDNRWCGNVQRQHKSNHVYFVADLKFAHVYQKCHDFECAHYRSPEIGIPKEVNPIFDKVAAGDDALDGTLDEELMKLFDGEIDVVGDSQERNGHTHSEGRLCNDVTNTLEDEFFDEDTLDSEMLKLSSAGNMQAISGNAILSGVAIDGPADKHIRMFDTSGCSSSGEDSLLNVDLFELANHSGVNKKHQAITESLNRSGCSNKHGSNDHDQCEHTFERRSDDVLIRSACKNKNKDKDTLKILDSTNSLTDITVEQGKNSCEFDDMDDDKYTIDKYTIDNSPCRVNELSDHDTIHGSPSCINNVCEYDDDEDDKYAIDNSPCCVKVLGIDENASESSPGCVRNLNSNASDNEAACKSHFCVNSTACESINNSFSSLNSIEEFDDMNDDKYTIDNSPCCVTELSDQNTIHSSPSRINSFCEFAVSCDNDDENDKYMIDNSPCCVTELSDQNTIHSSPSRINKACELAAEYDDDDDDDDDDDEEAINTSADLFHGNNTSPSLDKCSSSSSSVARECELENESILTELFSEDITLSDVL